MNKFIKYTHTNFGKKSMGVFFFYIKVVNQVFIEIYKNFLYNKNALKKI